MQRARSAATGAASGALGIVRALLLAAAAASLGASPVCGQWFNSSAWSDLSELQGEVVPGKGECFWVRDLWGGKHIAELVGEVDKRYVVKSPDGNIQAIRFSEAIPTPLKYVAFRDTELKNHLLQGQYRKGGWKGAIDGQHVYIYKCSEEYLVRVQRIVSKTYAATKDYLTQRQFELKLHVDPLTVVVYATEEDYRKESGAHATHAAFYDACRNHIVLYEKPEEGTPAPKAAQQGLLGTVAHETVHQTLYNVGVQARLVRWPFWTTEGIPEYLEPSVDLRTGDFTTPGKVNDYRLGELRSLEGTSQHFRLARDLVAEKPDTSSPGYSMAWGYVHYMAQRRTKEFRAYLKTLQQRKPLEGLVKPPPGKPYPTEESVFVQHFGRPPRDFYNAVVEHLSTMKHRDLAENDIHLVIAVEYVKLGRTVRDCRITLDPKQVDRAKEVLLKSVPTAERSAAQFQVREFENRKAANRFGSSWNGSGGVIVLE